MSRSAMPAIATSCTALPEFPPCEQVVIIVFPNVEIPAGAPVMSASILFDVDEVRPGQSDDDCLISIMGEADANPAMPTDAK